MRNIAPHTYSHLKCPIHNVELLKNSGRGLPSGNVPSSWMCL